MGELKTIKLEDAITLVYGKSLTKDTRVDGPFNVYGSNGIVGTHNEAIFKGPGIVIGRKGTVGSVVLSKGDFYAIDTTYVLELKDQNDDLMFWYYFLQSLELQHMNSHSAVPGLSRDAVYKREVKIVSDLKERREIATILSSLDDKIELNNRMNKTLEEMAQSIFKNWFVDFEPFQDGDFEDSELGMIPKAWSCKSLYDMAEFVNGTSFKKDEYSESGLPIVKIAEIKNGFSQQTQYFNGEKDKKYYISNGDMLFSWSGNPQTSIDTFIWVDGEAILNQHIFKVITNANEYCFVYQLLKLFKPEFTRIASSKQTTGLGHVTIQDLKRLKFPYKKNVVEDFEKLTSSVIEKYTCNLLENRKLEALRGSLLPRLMSGEISVPIEEVQ